MPTFPSKLTRKILPKSASPTVKELVAGVAVWVGPTTVVVVVVVDCDLPLFANAGFAIESKLKLRIPE
ncbi:hypothetical protein LBWT_25710 [Leptolyngbya boryana IAM M-101]|nr:hypothetical protein LBWT_25710 [Leptolyngbya boryana IAM M-101]BAS62995.1 hypothetical protein LBDG_25710 [Leptolyngbya boryana dg5]